MNAETSESVPQRLERLQGRILEVGNALFLMDTALEGSAHDRERVVAAAQAQLLTLRETLSSIAEDIELVAKA